MVQNELSVEMRDPKELRTYGKALRRPKGGAIAAMVGSIKRFGFRQPVVVDTADVVIVGHVRLAAALQMRLEKIPVHVADISAEKARLYRVADNRTHDHTSWEVGALIEELTALSYEVKDDRALLEEMTGFEKEELLQLLPPMQSLREGFDELKREALLEEAEIVSSRIEAAREDPDTQRSRMIRCPSCNETF